MNNKYKVINFFICIIIIVSNIFTYSITKHKYSNENVCEESKEISSFVQAEKETTNRESEEFESTDIEETTTEITTKEIETEPETESFSKIKKNKKYKCNTCEFKLIKSEFVDRIKPENLSGLDSYHYLDADQNKKYLKMVFDIKNLRRIATNQDNVFEDIKVYYDDSYEYDCSYITINSKGDIESYTDLYDIDPLETIRYYIVCEVPDEVVDSNKKLICEISVDGKLYKYIIR